MPRGLQEHTELLHGLEVASLQSITKKVVDQEWWLEEGDFYPSLFALPVSWSLMLCNQMSHLTRLVVTGSLTIYAC